QECDLTLTSWRLALHLKKRKRLVSGWRHQTRSLALGRSVIAFPAIASPTCRARFNISYAAVRDSAELGCANLALGSCFSCAPPCAPHVPLPSPRAPHPHS